MTTNAVTLELPDIRVAKIATAESLSGLSQIEYHLGYLASSPDRIFIRLYKNSGNGKFNTNWLALADIEKALAKVPADESFTADAFTPLFLHRSVNSRYFTIACLLDAGLLRRSEEGYVRHTPTELWAELQALIQAGTHLQSTSMPQGAGHIAVKAAKVSTEVKKSPKKTAVPMKSVVPTKTAATTHHA